MRSANLNVKYLFLAICLLFAFTACTSMRHFNAMNEQEKAEYMAIAQKMTVEQRKTYLAKGNQQARLEYLKEIKLQDEYVNEVAFKHLDDEKRQDFVKAYVNSSPEEINRLIGNYDTDTQDRIRVKDLQYGWNGKQVMLSLGKPSDILERSEKGKKNQLWIYNEKDAVTYLYFEDGKLKNWAR